MPPRRGYLDKLFSPHPMLDTTFFAALALLAFVGLRSHWTGRLLVLLLLSPVLRYGLAIFGFTIRLHLSAWAATILQLGGLDVRAEGNVLVRQIAGTGLVEMAVDPACMGLHLTGLSVLVAVFWLVWFERQKDLRVPLVWVLVYGLSAFGLTVFCNLIRIVVLVALELGPASPLHGGLGLVCVVVYAWIPAGLLAHWVVRRFGKPAIVPPTQWSLAWGLTALVLGGGVIAFTARPATADRPTRQTLVNQFVTGGFSLRKTTPDGFYQLTRPGSLLYVKPLPDWWSADHSPAVCWRGGGYELRRVREGHIGQKVVYLAELRHPKRPTLYTAWWFTNGSYHTIGQLDFRWRMARGGPGFALVNLTTEKPLSGHQIGPLLR
ncbi:MAG: exosortase N [Cytophagales bacterium]|nr:MAG: exosortase N [Cytophagales bacterium]